MIRRILFAACLAVLLIALPSYVGARGLACAERISSRRGDRPAAGHLIGTETITETDTYRMGGTLGQRGTGSIDTARTRTVSRTYQVGTYEMNDGRQLKVDCRNYTIRR